MARSVPLLVNFVFTLASESASTFPRDRTSNFIYTEVERVGAFLHEMV